MFYLYDNNGVWLFFGKFCHGGIAKGFISLHIPRKFSVVIISSDKTTLFGGWAWLVYSWFQRCGFAGGMTEEKKTLRRKALAKWLKESILRLGPTFIKIGQQFSTRVDILAQEYVDQLSELQVEIALFWMSFTSDSCHSAYWCSSSIFYLSCYDKYLSQQPMLTPIWYIHR